MASPIDPLVLPAYVGGGSLVLAAALMVGGGVRRGPGVWLAAYLAATGAQTILFAWRLAETFNGGFGDTLGALFYLGSFLAAAAGLSLALFVVRFASRPDGAEARDLLVALAVGVVASAATWTLAGTVTDVGQAFLALALTSATIIPALFTWLALPLRFHHARAAPWARAAWAWFGPMLLLLPMMSGGAVLLFVLRAGVGLAELYPVLAGVVLFAAAMLYLRPTLTGPAEASRLGRNLCLLLFGIMTAGVLAGRVASELQLAWLGSLRYGLMVVVAAMALHAVFRQRLFEEAPVETAEAPAPRQVEGPPPA